MYNFLFTWHVAHFLQKCKQEKNILHIHNYDKVKKFEYKNEKRFLGNKVTKTLLQAWEFLFYTHIHPSMVNIWQNLSLLPVTRFKVNEKLPYWKVNKRLVEFTHTFLDMKVWYPSIVSSYIYGVGVEQITYGLGLGKSCTPPKIFLS